MTTYNGEKYIREQIESILSQTYTNWVLHIRDDASTDSTVAIVNSYAGKYPDKIKVYVNQSNTGSPKTNFFKLIMNSEADVIFTCDQDDIWNNNKIEITLKEFVGVKKPLLVHTDLIVTDENNNTIYPSMIKSQHIDVRRTSLNNIICQNIVTGCTMAFNKELKKILKEPEGITVHDWWIAAVASIYGEIRFIDTATIRYRRHSNNVCGAQNMSSGKYIAKRAADSKRAKDMLSMGYAMADEILKNYKIEGKSFEMLTAYSHMNNKNKIQKIAVLLRYGIWKSGIVRKLGQLYFV